MRPFPIFVAVFFCACASPPEKRENSPEGAAAAFTQADSDPGIPTTVQADSGSPAPASPDDGGEGVAELRRLAATRQMILIGDESDSADKFVPDEASTPSAYGGRYFFGFSEGESTLTLTVHGNAVIGTLAYSDWENERWVGKEVRLDGGRIAGASLVAPGWSGVFVRYQGRPGLVILHAPTDRLSVDDFGEKEDVHQETTSVP